MNDYEKIGVPGILIAGIIWLAIFIKNLMKDSKEEREENRKSQERRDEEHNRSLNKNTEVLIELTTLFKSMKK